MSSDWWRPHLNEDGLSQGDVVGAVPFVNSVAPPAMLKKATGKGGAETWVPTADPPKKSANPYYLSEGREALALVVSHGCELDEETARPRVLVAPVRGVHTLSETARERLLEQQSRRMVPLPDLPGHGTCFADLRLIMSISRELIPDESRLASMSETGVKRLQVQLAVFFARFDRAALDSVLPNGD